VPVGRNRRSFRYRQQSDTVAAGSSTVTSVPPPMAARRPHRATVDVDDRLDDRQAQPGARRATRRRSSPAAT
jgi:hypothetical protein